MMTRPEALPRVTLKRHRGTKTWPLVAGLALLLVTACGNSGTTVTADDPVLAGLDPALVQEVLNNPSAKQNLQDTRDDEAATRSLAQGMVTNFSDCRTAARLYQSWKRTAKAPALPSFVTPSSPVEPANWGMKQFRSEVKSALDSGDPQNLVGLITGESSCGEWIPATPGDVNGPTIAQSLKNG